MDHTPHAAAGAETALLVLFLLLPALALLLYVLAAARDPRWSLGRSASFALGIGLVIAAMSPPMTDWAHADLRGHMAQHLLLGMYAPIALVLGAPVTRLLRSLPTAAGRRVVRFLDGRPLRFLVHPMTAALLDVGGMYLLYLTPLFALSTASPAVHVLVHVHFLVSGCLFTWAIVGPDAAPRRPGFRARLVVLGLAMAAHATLARLMYAHGFPRVGAGAGEVEAAAMLMYYGGDLAELAVAVALFAGWLRGRSRRGRTGGLRVRRAAAEGFVE